ncbi:hypothetical protein FA95DRAFT_1194600 [Auriscalpium vulgare]|uniref:Uncharacterized protein n=1 Tax=Auriscalpium vulgare TaxID=40419 RepID=A0ACB8R487_9AGAM|nr:hypothetical protein FA95DRAFT_1194600 [Auriscalpium vulgare]
MGASYVEIQVICLIQPLLTSSRATGDCPGGSSVRLKLRRDEIEDLHEDNAARRAGRQDHLLAVRAVSPDANSANPALSRPGDPKLGGARTCRCIFSTHSTATDDSFSSA